jgi:hypothetical protein
MALRQLGQPEPKDVPFRDLIPAEKDITLDPFDAWEMLGMSAGGPPQPPRAPQQGGGQGQGVAPATPR